MKMSEATQLRKVWGNEPCDHSNVKKEYHLGSSTGDYVCTQCGLAKWGKEGFNKDK